MMFTPKTFARAVAMRYAPAYLWRRRMKRSALEAEIALLPCLADPNRIAVDVGANWGVYTGSLLKLAREVIAYEPVPELAAFLRGAFAGRTCQVIEAALSDVPGFHALALAGPLHGLSSLETVGTLDGFASSGRRIEVPLRRLDDEKFPSIGFIKIDVEGHELAVLRGAKVRICADRPRILVEIEERHRAGALAETSAFFDTLQYDGLFFDSRAGQLLPIAVFDRGLHQDSCNLNVRGLRTGPYYNNFIFLPREILATTLDCVSQRGIAVCSRT